MQIECMPHKPTHTHINTHTKLCPVVASFGQISTSSTDTKGFYCLAPQLTLTPTALTESTLPLTHSHTHTHTYIPALAPAAPLCAVRQPFKPIDCR